MMATLGNFAQSVAASPLHDYAVHWLRTVPGLPPIVQTVHILSIACIVGSAMMIDLRVLGLAVPSQNPAEMARRLMPWMWFALVSLFFSGAMFLVARPVRYFANPVFAIKFALLIPAVALSALLAGFLKSRVTVSTSLRITATLSLISWLGVIFAGRWIAYSDYLFPPD
jgi:hypothetical protein